MCAKKNLSLIPPFLAGVALLLSIVLTPTVMWGSIPVKSELQTAWELFKIPSLLKLPRLSGSFNSGSSGDRWPKKIDFYDSGRGICTSDLTTGTDLQNLTSCQLPENQGL